MAYSYSIETSKKDNKSTIGLSACHLLFSVINLFLSTFLIAHIYTLTNDLYSYVFNVGIYQLSAYICMFVSYFIFSFWVDKSNRIWVYRVANIIEAVLVIVTIFYGKDLAKIVVLAGVLSGLAHGAYYASYNVLKQEMVSRKSMDNFAVVLTVLGKVVNVVCPILLGMLIDVSTYTTVAIYVLALSVIQIVISFFIKSKRPENSDFNLKKYFKNLKKDTKINRKIKFIYKICIIYGFTSVVSILLNVNIMMQFGSSFSLGSITSVFACLTIVVLLLFKKFTKAGKRSVLFIVVGMLPFVSAIIFAIVPHVATLIIYHLCLSICEVMTTTTFDIIRNKNLKENGMYSDIAEHQCVVESIFQIIRIISFVLLIAVGLIKNLIVFRVFFVVVVLAHLFMALMIMIYEKKDRDDKF